jgi:hypothetical protein
MGFKPTIPASALTQTYALDRAATGIGQNDDTCYKYTYIIYFIHKQMFHHVVLKLGFTANVRSGQKSRMKGATRVWRYESRQMLLCCVVSVLTLR